MTPAQLAAVSYLARYSGQTHLLYAYQLRRWFAWCETHHLDALIGVQRAQLELSERHLRECGLRDSSICTMMHGVRGYYRFAHIDGHITADPTVYVRLPKLQSDETRTQGLDRLELIRFLQVAQTITVHHDALAFLLGINALRASEAAAVRIRTTPKRCAAIGSYVLLTWGANHRRSPLPCRCCVPSSPVGENAPRGASSCGRCPASRSIAAMCIAWSAASPSRLASRGTSARIRCGAPPSRTPAMPAFRFATPRSSPGTPTPGRCSTTIELSGIWTATASTSSPLTSLASAPRLAGQEPAFAKYDSARGLLDAAHRAVGPPPGQQQPSGRCGRRRMSPTHGLDRSALRALTVVP